MNQRNDANALWATRIAPDGSIPTTSVTATATSTVPSSHGSYRK